jgi:hypothetical protein
MRHLSTKDRKGGSGEGKKEKRRGAGEKRGEKRG